MHEYKHSYTKLPIMFFYGKHEAPDDFDTKPTFQLPLMMTCIDWNLG